MIELIQDYSVFLRVCFCVCAMGSYSNYVNGELEPQKLTPSASFKAKKKPAAAISRAGSEMDDIITLLHGSDPVRVELTRLENEVRGLCVFYVLG